MATYRELVYIILDELKIQSDDSYFEEEHIMFLINKYRPLILKQRYSDVRKEIPEANFQSINVTVVDSPEVTGSLDGSMFYKKSNVKIPSIMNLNGGQRIITLSYSKDYWGGEITYVNKDRFKYIGHNKWLKKTIYGTIGPDEYLYIKSEDTNINSLVKVKITSIFEDPTDVNKLDVDSNGKIKNPLDIECPLEANLIPVVTEMIIKSLLPAQLRESDTENDAQDGIMDEYNKNAYAQRALANRNNLNAQ